MAWINESIKLNQLEGRGSEQGRQWKEIPTEQRKIHYNLPLQPLLITILMQTIATMAAFSLPAAAPEIALDLNIDANLVGFHISMVYGVGIVSAILSPRWIKRYGPARIGQLVVLVTIGMLIAAASGSFLMLGFSAVILGCGYGATAPISTHVLVPRTPVKLINLVLSIRQIGVPLGGVLSGLLIPPLVLFTGWKSALLLQILPAVFLLLLLQKVRDTWDDDRDLKIDLLTFRLIEPLHLLRTSKFVRNLSLTCFFYAGIQLCFISFMVVQLTKAANIDLIFAGWFLAIFQISGVVSRPIWGWIADQYCSARRLLCINGLIIGLSALAAGQIGSDWPLFLVFCIFVGAGISASGFTGIAYGEFSRLGGKRGTDATAVGSAAMFSGVMVLPSLFGLLLALNEEYSLAYIVLAFFAFIGSYLMRK